MGSLMNGVLMKGYLARCKVCWSKLAAVLWVRARSWLLQMESCTKPEM